MGDDGRGLRLTFTRLSDRFSHAISVIDGDCEFVCLESCDRCDAVPWPASPPLQQLSIEQRTASSVALLVGMAGTSHWSASMEAVDGKTEFVFDIACRTKQLPSQIGSQYRYVAPQSGGSAENPRPIRCVLKLLDENRHWELQQVGDIVTVKGLIEPGWATATIRWRYKISMD